jgi:hypothetical protein
LRRHAAARSPPDIAPLDFQRDPLVRGRLPRHPFLRAPPLAVRDRPGLPFLVFFPAIIVSVVVFDRGIGRHRDDPQHRPGALLRPAARLLRRPRGDNILSVAVFFTTGLFIAPITEALHGAYVEAEEGQQETDRARPRPVLVRLESDRDWLRPGLM